MRKLGAGVVLLKEEKRKRERSLEFYLLEESPSIQGVMVSGDDILDRMSFESWSFFNSSRLVCEYRSNKNALYIHTRHYENLLKVFPFVAEEVTPSAVWFPPTPLLDILEELETEFENPVEKLERAVSFFFGDIGFKVASKKYLGVYYYITVWQGKELVVVTEGQISKHEKEEKLVRLLKDVRTSILFNNAWTHEKFLERLKAVKEEKGE